MPTYRFGDDVLIPYMRETSHDRTLSTQRREAQLAHHLLDFFGSRRISHSDRGQITGSVVREYRELRKLIGVTATTVLRELSLASRACNYAISEWDYDMPNPFARRLISDRDRRAITPVQWYRLTDADLASLLLAAPAPVVRDVIEFAYWTGMRQGEVLGLTWDRVDGDVVTFTPSDQKSRRYGQRILCHEALAVLARRPDRGPYVFSDDVGKRLNRDRFNKAWRKTRKGAGLPAFQFRWLRNNAGQRLLEQCGEIEIVQHQLGHADVRTTQKVYTVAHVDRIRAKLSVEK